MDFLFALWVLGKRKIIIILLFSFEWFLMKRVMKNRNVVNNPLILTSNKWNIHFESIGLTIKLFMNFLCWNASHQNQIESIIH